MFQEWIDEKVNNQGVPSENVHYVYNQSMFDEVDVKTAEYLLGKFSYIAEVFPKLVVGCWSK